MKLFAEVTDPCDKVCPTLFTKPVLRETDKLNLFLFIRSTLTPR
jgi:hypothetical protein